MPTMEMERIPISEWEQQAAKPSHTTPSNTAALAITKNDDNGNIAPTVSECRSDIDYYPIPAQPAADDDTPRRADDNDTTSSSAASCHVANTLRSTNTNRSYDYDE